MSFLTLYGMSSQSGPLLYIPSNNIQAALLECSHKHFPPCPLGITDEVLVPVSLTLGNTHWSKIVFDGGKIYLENL